MAKTIDQTKTARGVNLRFFTGRDNKNYLLLSKGNNKIFLDLEECYQLIKFLDRQAINNKKLFIEERIARLEKKIEELEKIVKNK